VIELERDSRPVLRAEQESEPSAFSDKWSVVASEWVSQIGYSFRFRMAVRCATLDLVNQLGRGTKHEHNGRRGRNRSDYPGSCF
jgi:hypothetical protein